VTAVTDNFTRSQDEAIIITFVHCTSLTDWKLTLQSRSRPEITRTYNEKKAQLTQRERATAVHV